MQNRMYTTCAGEWHENSISWDLHRIFQDEPKVFDLPATIFMSSTFLLNLFSKSSTAYTGN